MKKKLNLSVEQKRQLIDKTCHGLSVVRQCELLGLARASFYYQSIGESAQNLRYMRLIDEQYTKTPFYGVPRLTAWLRSEGYSINPKRVARLMRKMGLAAIYPKPTAFSYGHPIENVSLFTQGIEYH